MIRGVPVVLLALAGAPAAAQTTITLMHEGGAVSHVEASKLNHIDAREFRAYGDLVRFFDEVLGRP